MPISRDGATPAPTPRPLLLLVNLGTPAAPTAAAVRRYLGQFLRDPRVVRLPRWLWWPILYLFVLPLRSAKVARKYAAIWMEGGSPLLVYSRALARAVQEQLPDVNVRLAMRYGEPSIASQLRESDGATQVAVLPLYPQFSASTTATVHDEVDALLRKWRSRPTLALLADYHLDEAWLDAVAGSVRAYWGVHGRGERLLLSFHGLPVAQVRAGDPYEKQCQQSARALAQRLELPDTAWALTYQSRFGKAQWLQPYLSEVLQERARSGDRRVDVVCPGFAVDCLETLEEIAVENAAVFRAAGGEVLNYIPALNASEAHARALAAIARRELLAGEQA